MPHIIIVTFVILIVTGLIVGNYFYGVAVKRSSKTGNVLEINSDKKTFMGDDFMRLSTKPSPLSKKIRKEPSLPPFATAIIRGHRLLERGRAIDIRTAIRGLM